MKNFVGRRFGKLMVLAFSGRVKSGVNNVPLWLCKCDCGNEKTYRQGNLLCSTLSCGCLQIERTRKANTGRVLTAEHKSKISAGGKGRVVSDETRKRLSEKQIGPKNHRFGIPHTDEHKRKVSDALTGEKNSRWKGGKYRPVASRSNDVYKKWKTAVFQRDSNKCKGCGSKDRLQAHHILSFTKFPEHRYSVDNGLTLCKPCHNKVHSKKVPERLLRLVS